MMGQLPAQQNALFYEFCLENHIPEDHLLRQVDQFLDFDQAREHLDPFYSHTGRPSIDPELMIRMLLIGYCYGIRSERRLCEEIRFNLAYRWFCRLGLEVEVLFAHLKRIMNFDRLRLRGITGAHDEFLLAATVQNLKKLAQQRYKPPDFRIGAPVLC